MYASDLIQDSSLLSLLEVIEAYYGYKIKAKPLSADHKQQAIMSISVDKNGQWTILYDDNSAIKPQIFCHEMMHMVLWIEGWPSFSLNLKMPFFYSYQFELSQTISNLVLHPQVWNLVAQYGYDERGCYETNRTILSLKNDDKPPILMAEKIATAFCSVSIAQGLLQPEFEETKDELRLLASQKHPQEYAKAESIVLALSLRKVSCPQLCLTALKNVLDIIELPRESLVPSYIDHACPTFRDRILPKDPK